jgi:hypothetical protein
LTVAVSALGVTPVKGTRLQVVDRVQLGRDGALGDRRFFVIDEDRRMVNAKQLGDLITVEASCDGGELVLAFPDGIEVVGPVELGERVVARFYSGERAARIVAGPFSAALSSHVGTPVRLVESEGSIDRGPDGAASLISRASLARLAEVADVSEIDARRFRMLIEVDGLDAHAEDSWVGEQVQIGEAIVRFRGHVGRCLITSRDPDSGVVDLPTLDLFRSYRSALQTTEPLPFGIYGEVVRPGPISVGDPVAPITVG